MRLAPTEKDKQLLCHAPSPAELDFTTDARALAEYQDAIAKLLREEKFEELDCLADTARSGKTRFPGGLWKLRNIYIGLDSPRPGHPTEEDWLQRLELVERWNSRNSHSVTAPVLAESCVSYGWDAWGDGSTDSVTDCGSKLFGESVAKAKAILDNASTLATKCPDWFMFSICRRVIPLSQMARVVGCQFSILVVHFGVWCSRS